MKAQVVLTAGSLILFPFLIITFLISTPVQAVDEIREVHEITLKKMLPKMNIHFQRSDFGEDLQTTLFGDEVIQSGRQLHRLLFKGHLIDSLLDQEVEEVLEVARKVEDGYEGDDLEKSGSPTESLSALSKNSSGNPKSGGTDGRSSGSEKAEKDSHGVGGGSGGGHPTDEGKPTERPVANIGQEAQRYWNKWNPQAPTNEVRRNLSTLDNASTSSDQRWDSADWFADEFDLDKDQLSKVDKGPEGNDREELKSRFEAEQVEKPADLRARAYDSKTNPMAKEGLRREINKRAGMPFPTALAKDFGIRPERAMEYAQKLASGDTVEAAKMLAELVASLNENQMKGLMDQLKNANFDDPELGAYYKKLAAALGNGELDEEDKAFKLAFEEQLEGAQEKVKEFNKYVDILNDPNVTEEQRNLARAYLRQNYDPEVLADFIAAQLASGNAERAAQIARAMAWEGKDGKLFLELAAKDINFKGDIANRSLFLGNAKDDDGTALAALMAFVSKANDDGSDFEGSLAANLLQSFEINYDHEGHSGSTPMTYFATPDGKLGNSRIGSIPDEVGTVQFLQEEEEPEPEEKQVDDESDHADKEV